MARRRHQEHTEAEQVTPVCASDVSFPPQHYRDRLHLLHHHLACTVAASDNDVDAVANLASPVPHPKEVVTAHQE